MRNHLTIFLLFAISLLACETPKEKNDAPEVLTIPIPTLLEEPLSDSVSIENLSKIEIALQEILGFSIPNIDSLNQKTGAHFCTFKNNQFSAKLFNSDTKNDILALTELSHESNCTYFESFLYEKQENGGWKNIFNEVFPEMDMYSFYSLEDFAAQKLEGDEQTSFAGYQFQVNENDELAVQFMFCCGTDVAMTEKLNEEGVQLTYTWNEETGNFE